MYGIVSYLDQYIDLNVAIYLSTNCTIVYKGKYSKRGGHQFVIKRFTRKVIISVFLEI